MSHDHYHEEKSATGIDRRSFLKLAGFSFAGAFMGGCGKGGVEKAIPFLIQSEEITPGLAYWYATTCAGCDAGCGILAKCREGRPIKLEGNKDHPLSKGGLCAVGQASILGLYDSHRLRNPLIHGRVATWEKVDAEVTKELAQIRQSGGAVRFLTGTIASPTARAMIKEFLSGFRDGKHVEYDAISYSSILDAYTVTHGKRLLPRYRFDKAEVIVSFDSDFLGNWISPVEFTKSYHAGRSLEGDPPRCSYHVQFESRVSLTGSNADDRICVSPAEMYDIMKRLVWHLAGKSGTTLRVQASVSSKQEQFIAELAERIWKAQGKALVVCGVNSHSHQVLTNCINHLVGSYDHTVDLKQPSLQYRGNDAELHQLRDEIQSGTVAALFVAGANPSFDLPIGSLFPDAIKKIPLVVSFADRADDTASHAGFVCPPPHPLESWMDYEAVDGVVSVAQPTTPPLMNTRPFVETLASWMGRNDSALELIRREWKRTVFTRQVEESSFDLFWNKTLERGFARVTSSDGTHKRFDGGLLTKFIDNDSLHTPNEGEYTLLLYPSLTMLDGRHAHNPWLHELPDPVTKIVWDNVASISPATADRFGLMEGDVLRIVANDNVIELPVYVQLGQHDSVIVTTLGYGRSGTERFTDIGPSWLQAKPTVKPGERVGKNAASFIRFSDRALSYVIEGVTLSATGSTHLLAKTQEYDLLEEPSLLGKRKVRRDIIQQTSLAAYSKDRTAGQFSKERLDSMWSDDHQYLGVRWGMVIDLNACTGCSACVVACQVENNIPVVGKDEVWRNREMSWIRIDRYYDQERGGKISVAHQPMMCQHCANAPCETVCPVLATVHSEEGLNQQIYNRCVGTRYCANNCPYKVRRFNWFQYRHGDELHRMVLNPDVTVRDRGVMEKCSFCVQRIQLAKIEAKRDGNALKDGAVQPACAQSCPSGAIVFGDMNDPDSEVAKRMKDPRHYYVLESLGIRPSIGYMTIVRNRSKNLLSEVQDG